jgi:SAM-dependent methyltransferase
MSANTTATSPPPANYALDGLRGDLMVQDDPSRISVRAPRLYAGVARQYLQLIKSSLVEPATKRDATFVSRQYEAGWTPATQEEAASRDANRAYFLVQGRPVYVNGWFIIKRYADLILEALERLSVESVLEVGSGRGRNLALLALKRPDLSLTGLELTKSGVENSRALAEDVPSRLLQVAGTEQSAEQAKASLQKIQFHQGNAMDMPFPDKSFDASFTSLVLEQVPRDYPRVLQQMRRVTRKFCIFNEAFDEANSWWGRAHLRRVDYFRASMRDFSRHGLEPVFFTTALPQKLTFRTGLMVARVLD